MAVRSVEAGREIRLTGDAALMDRDFVLVLRETEATPEGPWAGTCARRPASSAGSTPTWAAPRSARRSRPLTGARGGPGDLLLVTDGEVWNRADVIGPARRSGKRVFTIGEGSSVAEAFVRELAEQTGGACVPVHEREAGEKADEVPALRKVPQVLAAGWGGVGVQLPPRHGHSPAPVAYASLRLGTNGIRINALPSKRSSADRSTSLGCRSRYEGLK